MLSFALLINNSVASDKTPDATKQSTKAVNNDIKKGYNFDDMFDKKKASATQNTKDSIDISEFKKDSDEEYEQVKTDYYYKHEYVSPERLNNVVMGSCFAIKNNEDLKNDCLANTKNDDSWCFSIKNKNMMNSCLGQVKRDDSYCFSSRDKDMMNACVAVTRRDESYCFSVNNEDVKNSCLAQTKYDNSWCFSINNTNMKNACLAIVP